MFSVELSIPFSSGPSNLAHRKHRDRRVDVGARASKLNDHFLTAATGRGGDGVDRWTNGLGRHRKARP